MFRDIAPTTRNGPAFAGTTGTIGILKLDGVVIEDFAVVNSFANLAAAHAVCADRIPILDVVNWVKNGYPVRAHGMGGCQVRKGIDYGEIFDHHAVEFEYADGSRCSSECRPIPGCWSNVSEHFVGTKGTAELADPDRAIIRGANQ